MCIKGGKISAQLLKAALTKLLSEIEKKKQQSKKMGGQNRCKRGKQSILNQNEFDEELVHELIKRIYVGMDNSVEVEFKCSDPYQEVLAIMSEVQNE